MNEEITATDSLIRKLKNHSLIAMVIVGTLILSGIAGVLSNAKTIKEFLQPKPDFKAGVSGSFNINVYPSPLIYLYDKQSYDNAQSGKSIASISHAIHLDLINNKSVPVKLRSYKIRALLKYDEGGRVNLVKDKAGIKPEYTPSGAKVLKWRDLYNIGPINDKIFYVVDWSKARQIDFTDDCFDIKAFSNKQINPGESISGWLLFEVDEDLRYQPFEIKKYEAVLENSAGELSTIKIAVQKDDDTMNAVSGGTMKMLNYVDLTTIKWDICSIIDLKRSVKNAKPLVNIDLKNVK